jgi:hypothetical protein
MGSRAKSPFRHDCAGGEGPEPSLVYCDRAAVLFNHLVGKREQRMAARVGRALQGEAPRRSCDDASRARGGLGRAHCADDSETADVPLDP